MSELKQPAAEDPLPAGAVRIEVRVAELKQLFNAMDPSPFRERDLDPNAEEFIVGWGREAPRDAPLALLVRLNRGPGPPGGAGGAAGGDTGLFQSPRAGDAAPTSRAFSSRAN